MWCCLESPENWCRHDLLLLSGSTLEATLSTCYTFNFRQFGNLSDCVPNISHGCWRKQCNQEQLLTQAVQPGATADAKHQPTLVCKHMCGPLPQYAGFSADTLGRTELVLSTSKTAKAINLLHCFYADLQSLRTHFQPHHNEQQQPFQTPTLHQTPVLPHAAAILPLDADIAALCAEL